MVDVSYESVIRLRRGTSVKVLATVEGVKVLGHQAPDVWTIDDALNVSGELRKAAKFAQRLQGDARRAEEPS